MIAGTAAVDLILAFMAFEWIVLATYHRRTGRGIAPFTLAASQRGRPAWNLVVSNVPGPQFPLYLAGARLEANYPVSVVTDGLGLNITVMSYLGHLDFGIVADRGQMPDLWSLIDFLREELAALAPAPPAAAKGSRKTKAKPAAAKKRTTTAPSTRPHR